MGTATWDPSARMACTRTSAFVATVSLQMKSPVFWTLAGQCWAWWVNGIDGIWNHLEKQKHWVINQQVLGCQAPELWGIFPCFSKVCCHAYVTLDYVVEPKCLYISKVFKAGRSFPFWVVSYSICMNLHKPQDLLKPTLASNVGQKSLQT